MTDGEIKLQTEINSLWKILQADQIKKLTQAKTQVRLGDRFVGVAVDTNDAKHLLIPCPPGEGARGLWKSAAVVLDRRTLIGAEGATGTWLVLSCLRSELNDVFLRLVANVVSRLPSDQTLVLAACLKTLDEWRDLLGPLRRPELGPQDVVGLIGELIVLEKLVRVDPRLAMEAWEGPVGGRHDFRYGLRAIEAKATATRVGRFISIHGPGQLDAPPGGVLHLSWARLESTPGGTLGLPQLVARIRTTGVDRNRLSEILERRGYEESADQPAAKATYELTEWLLWEVNADFPRIVSASFVGGLVPSSVINLNYTVDLSGSQPEPLAEGEHERIWTDLLVPRDQRQG